jgi:hypothetical protein
LAGLGPVAAGRFDISATEMARRLGDDLREQDLRGLVAVGHSGGGPVIQLLHEFIPDRLGPLAEALGRLGHRNPPRTVMRRAGQLAAQAVFGTVDEIVASPRLLPVLLRFLAIPQEPPPA